MNSFKVTLGYRTITSKSSMSWYTLSIYSVPKGRDFCPFLTLLSSRLESDCELVVSIWSDSSTIEKKGIFLKHELLLTILGAGHKLYCRLFYLVKDDIKQGGGRGSVIFVFEMIY